MNSPVRLPPPYDQASARRKVRLAEDAWNSKDPRRVALAYSIDSEWRNRDEFIQGREEIESFLNRKWEKELEYRLVKELWAYSERKIAVRFQYEWCDLQGRWHRSYGNELWEFDDEGLMQRREASINDIEIHAEERKFRWKSPGPRPSDHAGIEAVR
jgi:nuclear transport factor 2 (NTF2) superfamily protein